MGIDIRGGDAVVSAASRAASRLPAAARSALRDTADQVAAAMRQAAPVRTGALRGSITVRIAGDTATIGPSQSIHGRDYPVMLEVGTARMAAQPYVAPAVDGATDRLSRALADRGRSLW